MSAHTAVRATTLTVLLALGACVSGTGSSTGQRSRGSTTLILEEELVSVQQLSAYNAIQRLRPTWFRTRSGGTPQVHIDGNPQMGGVGALQSLPTAEVQEMRYLNAADATTRFGTNYVSGVILVTTKR